MEPQIKRGIPMPNGAGTWGRWTSILGKLAVGESFCVSVADGKRVSTAQAQARRCGSLPGREFTTRTVVKNGERLVRCWRTK